MQVEEKGYPRFCVPTAELIGKKFKEMDEHLEDMFAIQLHNGDYKGDTTPKGLTLSDSMAFFDRVSDDVKEYAIKSLIPVLSSENNRNIPIALRALHNFGFNQKNIEIMVSHQIIDPLLELIDKTQDLSVLHEAAQVLLRLTLMKDSLIPQIIAKHGWPLACKICACRLPLIQSMGEGIATEFKIWERKQTATDKLARGMMGAS